MPNVSYGQNTVGLKELLPLVAKLENYRRYYCNFAGNTNSAKLTTRCKRRVNLNVDACNVANQTELRIESGLHFCGIRRHLCRTSL